MIATKSLHTMMVAQKQVKVMMESPKAVEQSHVVWASLLADDGYHNACDFGYGIVMHIISS